MGDVEDIFELRAVLKHAFVEVRCDGDAVVCKYRRGGLYDFHLPLAQCEPGRRGVEGSASYASRCNTSARKSRNHCEDSMVVNWRSVLVGNSRNSIYAGTCTSYDIPS